ncbi:MAG: hypothetical protein R3C02_20415 [Planctomycetaceae bacterium]
MKDIQRTSSWRTLTPWQGSLWPVLVVLVGGMLVPQSGVAGKYNKVLSVGETGPAWTDLPGTDGAEHSLQDLADKPVVVVAFTCLSCPRLWTMSLASMSLPGNTAASRVRSHSL